MEPILGALNSALRDLTKEDYEGAHEMVARVDRVNEQVGGFPQMVSLQFLVNRPDLMPETERAMLPGVGIVDSVNELLSLQTSDYATESQKAATRRIHAAAARLKNALTEEELRKNVYNEDAARKAMAGSQ